MKNRWIMPWLCRPRLPVQDFFILHVPPVVVQELIGMEFDILCPIESVDSSFVYMFMKILKIQDYFDPDGQFDSIAPPARSNPIARRGRIYLEFFKIFMNIHIDGTVHTLDGHSIIKIRNFGKLYSTVDGQVGWALRRRRCPKR